jgi:glucosamine-6-phosphate deaminase
LFETRPVFQFEKSWSWGHVLASLEFSDGVNEANLVTLLSASEATQILHRMKIEVFKNPASANEAAAHLLCEWLKSARTFMAASGNTPLELYRLIGERRLPHSHLQVFALDDYVGVPLDEPRNCANLLRSSVAQAWGIPEDQFHTVSSLPAEALASIQKHEEKIANAGGLDAILLGLGQNGHLGFNEPGSAPDSQGRVLDLQPISIEANRAWFHGKYAPSQGATVGLKTILAARQVLVLAYGSHKSAAVQAMVEFPANTNCPASFLQDHPNAFLLLDEAAAARLQTVR